MAGKYYEDLHVDMKIQHALGRTITEGVNPAFAYTPAKSSIHGASFLARRFTCGCSCVNQRSLF